MRILVTAGGTEEPVDGVRRLTNLSTGRTGAVIAEAMAAAGHRVLLLHGQRAAVPPESMANLSRESFLSFADLEALLRRHLAAEDWDAVVHLAAVSDYRVGEILVDGRSVPPGTGKIGTGNEVLLRLRPNPKLLNALKDWSRNPGLTVVGFKLTDGADEAEAASRVAALFAKGGVDYVVHNELRDISEGAHPAVLWKGSAAIRRVAAKAELADALIDILEGETS